MRDQESPPGPHPHQRQRPERADRESAREPGALSAKPPREEHEPLDAHAITVAPPQGHGGLSTRKASATARWSKGRRGRPRTPRRHASLRQGEVPQEQGPARQAAAGRVVRMRRAAAK